MTSKTSNQWDSASVDLAEIDNTPTAKVENK
jgi:hypothetical protein